MAQSMGKVDKSMAIGEKRDGISFRKNLPRSDRQNQKHCKTLDVGKAGSDRMYNRTATFGLEVTVCAIETFW